MADQEATKSPYPYLSFQTFLSLIEKMAREGVPARIDRSYLSYTSGINQSYLLTTLRWFGLVDGDDNPKPELVALVENASERPKLMADLILLKYSKQMALSKNATSRQLEETFEPLQGSSKRKAVTFFLHASRYAELTLSPHFKPLRAPRTTSGGQRKTTRRRQQEDGGGGAADPPLNPPSKGDTVEVTLVSGAVVTLTVSESLLALPRQERAYVLGLVDQLQDYESQEDEGGQI